MPLPEARTTASPGAEAADAPTVITVGPAMVITLLLAPAEMTPRQRSGRIGPTGQSCTGGDGPGWGRRAGIRPVSPHGRDDPASRPGGEPRQSVLPAPAGVAPRKPHRQTDPRICGATYGTVLRPQDSSAQFTPEQRALLPPWSN